MRVAICPGSFDPITMGHLDIITRACKLFDKVIVLVSDNPDKNATFTVEQKLDFIDRATAHLPEVESDYTSGLLADYMRDKNACAIVKGLRAISDFEYEFQMGIRRRISLSQQRKILKPRTVKSSAAGLQPEIMTQLSSGIHSLKKSRCPLKDRGQFLNNSLRR